MEDFKELIRPLYTECFTVNAHADPAAVMGALLADDFQSMNGLETKNKQQLIGQIQFLWNMMPDMKWDIQEMLQDGNRMIVRSMASGSPKGEFMGMSLDGSKSFNVMTIDIHTIENKQIREVYHLEDWASAMKQLRG